jgi:glycosyltransferase involved in cell wall biosynthesis
MTPSLQLDDAAGSEVAIVYRYVHHYRVGFYDSLRRLLADRGVRLRLLAGRPGPDDAARGDAALVPWAEAVRNLHVPLGRREIVWQACLRRVWSADLVVLEQASRLLLTYPLLAGQAVGGPRVALWGQGHHVLRHRASPVGEAVKRVVSRRVDWWFAYNERSVDVVAGLGYPRERVTAVRNAVDTRGLRELREAIGEAELAVLRQELGLSGDHVAVCCGSLYVEKRLPFLLAASDAVRAAVPDFELLVIGDGPEAAAVRSAAASRPWVHVLGALRGREKVRAMALARLQVLPGAVGLGVLDGFALGLPLVTTADPVQGHEFDYLTPGENGVVVEEWRDPAAYARAVAATLRDEAVLEKLREGCAAAAASYTIEAMAESFAGGVLAALRAPRLTHVRGKLRA